MNTKFTSRSLRIRVIARVILFHNFQLKTAIQTYYFKTQLYKTINFRFKYK